MDDFFYYLVVAQNIATGKGSTFNGLVATNGYHPLWEWIIAAWIRSGLGQHTALFLGLSVACSAVLLFALATMLLRRAGATWTLSAIFSGLVTTYAFHVLIEGMEVILTLPLMFALLCAVAQVDWWSRNGARGFFRGILIGLLTAALVLSRLDTVLFAVLLLLCLLAQPTLRARMTFSSSVGVLTAALPILIGYAFYNHVRFGVWEPVSGMAKQLKLDHGFTALAWHILFGKSTLQLGVICLIFAGIIALPLVWKTLSPVFRAITLACLLFPFLYTATLSWSSDWTLWPWYFYSLRAAICMALLVLSRLKIVGRWVNARIVQIPLVVLTCAALLTTRWTLGQPDIVRSAYRLQAFAQTHPGIYAMGDRAGAAGYLLDQPIVQTEGLMMDKKYLEAVRSQRPLQEVLALYGVRYYVQSGRPVEGTCLHALEPSQAGPHAPHLEAYFCGQSLAQWNELGIYTYVFDLKAASSHP